MLFFLLLFVNVHLSYSNDPFLTELQKYFNDHEIPIVIEDRLINEESGSMSSIYNGYWNNSSDRIQPLIIKSSSFKSIWNYVHIDELTRLQEMNGCFTPIDRSHQEYFVSREEQNRILTENYLPCEAYVAYRSVFCSKWMSTSRMFLSNFSYISFFRSIEQNDQQRRFVIIFEKIEDGMTLKKFLQIHSNQLTLSMVQYLIWSILMSILQLKQMYLIHLDLNLGNIFLLDNDQEYPIRLIDFAIVQFLYDQSDLVHYSENLHQSLRTIFLNCPSCYSKPLPIFAQYYQQTFQDYTIEQLIEHPWFHIH